MEGQPLRNVRELHDKSDYDHDTMRILHARVQSLEQEIFDLRNYLV